MNTTHIKSFLYVSKYGSISKAAVQLNYSTSTIYEHIKALESELGSKLYESTNAGIRLTEEGEIFLEYANKINSLLTEVHQIFFNSNETLRITASESSDFFIMKSLISQFVNKYPDVEIDYTKATTDISLEKILTGQCDASFISEPKFTTTKVACDYLCDLPLSFVAAPNHMCFKDGLLASHAHNILLCTMGFSVVSSLLLSKCLLFSDFFSAKRNIGDLQTLKELTYKGIGISLLPTCLIETDIAENRMRLVPELNKDFSSKLYILTELNRKKVNPTLENFLSLAHSIFSK